MPDWVGIDVRDDLDFVPDEEAGASALVEARPDDEAGAVADGDISGGRRDEWSEWEVLRRGCRVSMPRDEAGGGALSRLGLRGGCLATGEGS